MKTETELVFIGAAALIGYAFYQKWNNSIPERGDVKVSASSLSSGATLLQYGDTTYKFQKGDWNKLNLAQKILYDFGVSPNILFK